MDYIQNALEIVNNVKELAHREGKSTGFCIGNTVKLNSNNIYFMPIRHTAVMVTGGAVVYSEQQAVDIAQAIDGKVKCVLVDAEKKISALQPQAIMAEVARMESVFDFIKEER